MSLHHRFKEMFLDFMTLYILPLTCFVPLTGHHPINSGIQHFTKTLPSFIRLHKRHVPLRYYVCAKLHLARLAHYRVFDWRWFSEYQSVPILPQIILWSILTYSIVPPWIRFVEYGRKSVAGTPSVAPSIWGEISQLKIYILASSHSPEGEEPRRTNYLLCQQMVVQPIPVCRRNLGPRRTNSLLLSTGVEPKQV